MLFDRTSGSPVTAMQRYATQLRVALLLIVGMFLGLVASAVEPLLLLTVGGGLFVCVVGLVMILFFGYSVFWTYLIILLLGYQFLGKGFAYFGIGPVYVSELGLALAIITGLLTLPRNRLRRPEHFVRPAIVFLLLFMVWQALRTIPYLTIYYLDAARDAVLWGYATYALFICLLVPRNAVEHFFRLYGRVLPYFLVWLLLVFPFVKIHPLDIRFPGAPVPVVWLKSGDVGVHLAGIGAFMLLRLDLYGKSWSKVMVWFLWLLWGIAWIAYGVTNRAGMLSALMGIGVVLLWRPNSRWDRPLVLGGALMVMLLVLNLNLSLPVGKLPGGEQSVSFQQVVDNLVSTFKPSSGALEGTKQWRLNWWKTVLDYTIRGKYFWTGKGYGTNLADDDGFQVREDHSVRSPHNVFMAILARSGLPGLLLWISFLLCFGWMLVKRLPVKKHHPTSKYTRYALWILAYWLAFLFNASFDVFIEGPMGGVWFWSLVGMSLVYFARVNQDPEITTMDRN